MSSLTRTLKRSIVLEQRRADVRAALANLEKAIAGVEACYPSKDVSPHRQALRNLMLWCAPGSQLEREIMGSLALVGYRLELSDLEGEGGAA